MYLMMYMFFLIIALSSYALELPPMACSEKVKSALEEWKSTGEWQEEKQAGLKGSFFASPTDKVGEWVLARRIPNGTVVSKARDDGRIEIVFDEKKCESKTKTYTHKRPKGFTDSELESFIKKNKSGVIYVWSPRMSLSQNGIKEIQTAARSKKLPVLILLDKDIPESERAKLEAKLGKDVTRTVDSFELNMRHVQMHFPALLVFKDQKILPGVKYGYEKADRYKLDLIKLLR
jgi:hypothetical protein